MKSLIALSRKSKKPKGTGGKYENHDEQEGKEAKVFETNGIIFVANLEKSVRCACLIDGLSVVDIAELIFSLRKMLERTKEQFPDAAKLADINSALKGLSESFGDDLDDDEEADNDAGRV